MEGRDGMEGPGGEGGSFWNKALNMIKKPYVWGPGAGGIAVIIIVIVIIVKRRKKNRIDFDE
jgi:type IV secretory pathway VirB2 component (pilin)